MLGMVFAAGLGSRLRPLTERLPKPVVPLMNRPLASYSLERLAAAGVTRCVINTHHLAEEVPRALEGHVPAGMEVRFVHEPALLGTGGGLRNALSRGIAEWGIVADTPIVVMNGDIVFWPDLERAIATHRRLDAVATVVLRDDPRARQLGALEIDGEGRVRRLLGRPEHVLDLPAPLPLAGHSAETLPPTPSREREGEINARDALTEHMFTGVHVLSPRALEDLPEEGCVIRTAYRRWVDGAGTVGAIVDDAPWRDLGTPAEYLRAHLDLLDGRLSWPGDVRARSSNLVDASASIEGATLARSVVGAGATIEPGVQLDSCVVWPNARVGRSMRHAIITPHAVVEVGDREI